MQQHHKHEQEQPGRSLEARVEHLETASAFAERTVDELSTQLHELHRKVEHLTRRAGLLEERITKLAERLPPDEASDDRPEADDGDELRLPDR